MTFLDGTVVNIALRTIGEDLDASLAELQWITNGYLLSLASLILLGGSLGDRYGRRRVFVHRHRLVRARLAAVRARAHARDPDRGADPAGDRRRAADAGQPGDDPGLRSSRGPEPGDRRLVRARQHRAADRPFVGGALVQYADWRWIFLINLPLARRHGRGRAAAGCRRPRTRMPRALRPPAPASPRSRWAARRTR
jgi:hypothetical protein